MTRITTPFDNFLSDLAALWSEFWVIGVIALGIVVIAVTAGLVARQRSRAKFREPQYRRHTYWE